MTAVVLHPVVRTQGEIVARVREVRAEGRDLFGVIQQNLIEALDFEHAREFLVSDATAETWAATITKTTPEWARDYVDFAVGKILGHRGLSSGRSIDHYEAWSWLMGWDLPREPWGNYGAAPLHAFLDHFGWLDLWPDDERLDRMRNGDSCEPYCDEGCGR